MKTPDPTDSLVRWSREAANARAPDRPPPGFAARVLARALSKESVERDWLLWMLPRAVAAAAALVAAALLPSFVASSSTAESELTNLILQSSLPSQP